MSYRRPSSGGQPSTPGTTLLYKGKGADRESPASYRPIIRLNTDYKLAARTVASRFWIEHCMAAVGFGAGAQRWVHILHCGTTARVAFNGWHTDAFLASSGVFQVSPLSPLLFELAAQPKAAHAWQLAQQQGFQPI